MGYELSGLQDKVAVVTGAGRMRSIGRPIAVGLARAGCDVVLTGTGRAPENYPDDEKAAGWGDIGSVAEEVVAEGRRAIPVVSDVRDPQSVQDLVATTVAELGRVDIVVNNAGGSMPGPFMGTSEKSFNQAFQWNVTSAFNLTQLAVPHMLKSGGGSVINIASAAGRFNDRGFAAYGTAKAALIHLTANLAADLSPRIRVNAIAPGAIATSALDVVLQNEALESEMKRRTPLGRLGQTDDIAAGALYLASPASGYVTGRVLDIDGGLHRSNLDMGLPDLE
jgi:7-alpha-hydroxysteroid dehydrogenase